MNLLKMSRDISELKSEVKKLRPALSVGLLTSQTTRGTFRSANSFQSNNNTTNNTSVKARWT